MRCLLLLLSVFAGTAFGQICPGGQFSDDDRTAILKYHNDLRSKIARGVFVAKTTPVPAAGDMQAMTWDCSVEASAQAYANTCPQGHSHAPGLGENLFWSWSTQPIPIAGSGISASNSWANEFQDYGWPGNPYQGQSNVGHATQMIWSTSNLLGCGANICPSTNAGFQYEIVVVCQYKPQGNILTVNMFQEGAACSSCPSGTSCQTSTGLCAAPGSAGPTGPPTTTAAVATTSRPITTTARPPTTAAAVPTTARPVATTTAAPPTTARAPETTSRPVASTARPVASSSARPASSSARPASASPYASSSPRPSTSRPSSSAPSGSSSRPSAPSTPQPPPSTSYRPTGSSPRPSSPPPPSSTSYRPASSPKPSSSAPSSTSPPRSTSTYPTPSRPIGASTPPGVRTTTPQPIVEVTVPPGEHPPCYI